MKPVQDVYATLCQRLLSKCNGVVAGRQEMEALAPHYCRYTDCRKQVKEDWKRIIYILRLVGPDRAAAIGQSDTSGILHEIVDNPSQSDDPSVNLPLWKAMREYLREAGESKVDDIRAFLQWLGYPNVTRQAIESSIVRHKRDFGSRTKGHERIVWVKEKEEGESSSSSDDD